jgi:hypothetical protein
MLILALLTPIIQNCQGLKLLLIIFHITKKLIKRRKNILSKITIRIVVNLIRISQILEHQSIAEDCYSKMMKMITKNKDIQRKETCPEIISIMLTNSTINNNMMVLL